jgi:hypothetical protein
MTIRFLKIGPCKKSNETHEQHYATQDVKTNQYLQHLKDELGRPLTIVDIGGSCQIRSPETTHVVDLLPLKNNCWQNDFQGEFFQGDIDLSDVWNRLFEYVDKNGKFDFAVCSHTLEDITSPHQAILNLFKIANAGMIAVPSKYIETRKWENLGGVQYLGYNHHKWIYTVKNGVLYGYPKMGCIEGHFVPGDDFISRDKYRQMFGNEGYEGQTEMSFLWEGSFPLSIVSAFMYHHTEFTENKRSAIINLLEQDDICKLIMES